VTDLGRKLIAAVEDATDQASVLGSADEMRQLGRLLRPLALSCAALLPFPNPIGLVGAWDPNLDPDAEQIPRI
jgi:hypothetical protein